MDSHGLIFLFFCWLPLKCKVLIGHLIFGEESLSGNRFLHKLVFAKRRPCGQWWWSLPTIPELSWQSICSMMGNCWTEMAHLSTTVQLMTWRSFFCCKKCRFNLFNRPTLLFGQVQDVRFSRSISWTGNSELQEVERECRTNLQACQCLKVVMILFRAKFQTHILEAFDTSFYQPTILWNPFVASTQHNSSVSESVKWFGQTNSSWECTAVDISSVELMCPT